MCARAVFCATIAGLLALPSAVFAAPKPITGKLPTAGYTVIALAEDGEATSTRVGSSNRFQLRPPAAEATLHLRRKNGIYAGPIVVGQSGKRAIMGVKAGVAMGALTVAKGRAVPKMRLPKRSLNLKSTAKAKKGIPIGAGVFGRVRAQSANLAGQGRDQDSDGIPGAFDVDDDGDLILDNFELQAAARATVAQQEPPQGRSEFRVFSNLKVQMSESLNANATEVTQAEIDRLVSSSAGLAIEVPEGDEVELDCGGLIYCRAGGTGRTAEPYPNGQAFPACCDPDGDGYGSIFRGSTGDFQLRTHANADEIGSGDTMIERITSGDATSELPGVLNFIFNTTPALIAWDDGAGNSGQVNYPIEPFAPGLPENPIEVAAGPSGDVIVTMTFWRPQRRAISGAGEGGGFVDIGRLQYTADVPNGPGGGGGSPGPGPGNCPQATYTPGTGMAPHPNDLGLLDQSGDGPADPQSTLTFGVNLTQCLASAGLTWSSGQNLQVDIQARSQFGDNAAQLVNFRLK